MGPASGSFRSHQPFEAKRCCVGLGPSLSELRSAGQSFLPWHPLMSGLLSVLICPSHNVLRKTSLPFSPSLPSPLFLPPIPGSLPPSASFPSPTFSPSSVLHRHSPACCLPLSFPPLPWKLTSSYFLSAVERHFLSRRLRPLPKSKFDEDQEKTREHWGRSEVPPHGKRPQLGARQTWSLPLAYSE